MKFADDNAELFCAWLNFKKMLQHVRHSCRGPGDVSEDIPKKTILSLPQT